jgi:hypothetical protein
VNSRSTPISRYFDRVDDRLGGEDEAYKTIDPMVVGAQYLSHEFSRGASLVELSRFIEAACIDPVAFYKTTRPSYEDYQYHNSVLKFRSAVATDIEPNNIAYASILEGSARRPAIIILRHWNAGDESYALMATIINRLGFTTALVTLPFHGRRKRPGAAMSDDFLSANLGRTIASVRQAVSDVRCTIDWLERTRHESFILIGASLGSCVAIMTAIVDPRICASALLLSAGDFAQVVWTGRATRHIRAALEGAISLAELQSVWRIISPAPFSSILARRNHRVLSISASRDTVVFPEYTAEFGSLLRKEGVALTEYQLGCGHYTLARAPFNVLALCKLIMFILGKRT